MITNQQRFKTAVDHIDAANREDPRREIFEGVEHPQELLYAMRMTTWLKKFESDPSEELQLAVRCQHICRWQIPRDQFPQGKSGYHQWRTTLAQFHADKAGEILRDLGYDDQSIQRVQDLLQKRNLKTDPEVQILEDVACLVFIESTLADFSKKHDDDRLVEIIRRTWGKMSLRGQNAALALNRPDHLRNLIERALCHGGP